MKIVKKLAHLEKNAKWAIQRSTRELPDLFSIKNISQRENIASPIVINLLNTWSIFMRTYYICCARGARNKLNYKISSSLSSSNLSPNDVIGEAIKSYHPNKKPMSNGIWDTRDEPSWHDSSVIIRLSTDFSFSNSADISAAFSLGFTAHKDLPTFRNYYAHKNHGTRVKTERVAANYSIASNQHPTDILLDYPRRTPTLHLIEVWVGELADTIDFLCG